VPRRWRRRWRRRRAAGDGGIGGFGLDAALAGAGLAWWGGGCVEYLWIFTMVGGFNHLEKYESQWEG